MTVHLATTLRVDLTLNHAPEGLYGVERRVVLEKRRGESMTHVLLKLLGYVLFFHPDLQIEASAGQHYKPDLVRFDEHGEPVQWIDCGKISPAKLQKIVARNRRATFQIIKPTERDLYGFGLATAGRIADPARVLFVAFRPGFLEELAQTLTDRARVTATVTTEHEVLYLDVDGRGLESPIIRRRPA